MECLVLKKELVKKKKKKKKTFNSFHSKLNISSMSSSSWDFVILNPPASDVLEAIFEIQSQYFSAFLKSCLLIVSFSASKYSRSIHEYNGISGTSNWILNWILNNSKRIVRKSITYHYALLFRTSTICRDPDIV